MRFTYSVLEVLAPVVCAALIVGAASNIYQGFVAIEGW